MTTTLGKTKKEKVEGRKIMNGKKNDGFKYNITIFYYVASITNNQ